MANSTIRETLLKRKEEIQAALKPLKKLEQELEEIDVLLATYSRSNRHGNEIAGHEDGCRCRQCDDSW